MSSGELLTILTVAITLGVVGLMYVATYALIRRAIAAAAANSSALASAACTPVSTPT